MPFISDRAATLRQVRPGDPVDYEQWNLMVDLLKMLSRSGVGGGNYISTGEGVYQRKQPSGTALRVKTFKVLGLLEDYVLAREWSTANNDTVGNDSVQIAYPAVFRKVEYHGQTINGVTYTYTSPDSRTATVGSDTENQRITPGYRETSFIVAVVNIEGGTGLILDRGGADEEEVIWVDLNVDGRVWAGEC